MRPSMNPLTNRRAHPHFDDRGTLSWHTRWRDAQAQAQAENKLIFIEFGRELCGQCRALVQSVVPRPDVAPLLQQHFVALAADADDSEDAVLDFAAKLEDATMLPFVLFTDARGQFLEGSSGAVDPRRFAETLKRLTSARA
jgi:thioredoxin-related protein